MQLPFRIPYRRIGHCLVAAMLPAAVTLICFPLGLLLGYLLVELQLIHHYNYPRRLHGGLLIELTSKPMFFLFVQLQSAVPGLQSLAVFYETILPVETSIPAHVLALIPVAIAFDAVLFTCCHRTCLPSHLDWKALLPASLWVYLSLVTAFTAYFLLLTALFNAATFAPTPFVQLVLVIFPLAFCHAVWCTLPWLLDDALPAENHGPGCDTDEQSRSAPQDTTHP